MTNRIVVGVLNSEQSDLLRRLTETAPIRLITSPILILSSPDDYVSDEALEFLDKKSNQISVKPYNYSYVYNPATHKTECLIACAASENTPTIASFRTESLGISSDTYEFVPYFLFAYDPMQSRASRHFFPGILHVLNRMDLRFELLTAEEDHFIYQNYNSEAQAALIKSAYLSKQEL
jgi:hypothetical protein